MTKVSRIHTGRFNMSKFKYYSKNEKDFVRLFKIAGKAANKTSLSKGFDNSKTDPIVQIALMHSELSEGVEAIRKNIKADSHIPEFTGFESLNFTLTLTYKAKRN